MKQVSLLIFGIFLLLLTSCKLNDSILVYDDLVNLDSQNQLQISISKGKEMNHPTFVIWQEDLDGSYLQTLFITRSYANGIFKHQMLGDSIWLKTPGESQQPAALPYWSYKKESIKQGRIIPSPKKPFVDAYSGATPNQSFQFSTSKIKPNKSYKLFLEVNQSWDWNTFWTNNKYPNSAAYKHSAQPSLIYSALVKPGDTAVLMPPIGHGNPKGENGVLNKDISTLSTAKNIFKSIKIKIQTQSPINETKK